MKIHAHFESRSSDCDGTYDRSHVLVPNDDERAGEDKDNWFGDIEFHNRVVASVVNTYSIHASGSLSVDRNNDGTVTLQWDEGTEEGGISTTVRICEDESCDTGEEPTFRDHTAERAGY
jgi:hypothetical protein